MGRRRDGVLATVALAAFLLAAFLVDATPSVPAFVLGALGTVLFELAATRAYDRVRRQWERPAVQAVALACTVGLVVVGAWLAPSRVLSAGIGALSAYLTVLSLVVVGILEPGHRT